MSVPPQGRERHVEPGLVAALECLGVVEFLAHGIGSGGMLVQDFEAQLIRPPVPVRRAAPGLVVERTFTLRHDSLLSTIRPHNGVSAFKTTNENLSHE